MRQVQILSFVIITTLVLMLGLCPVWAEVPEDTLTDVKRVLNASHGVTWLSGNEILQLAEKMKENPKEYLAVIDSIARVGLGFADGPASQDDLRFMGASIELVKYIGGESGKKLLLKWYRRCSDAEYDIRRTVQNLSHDKDVKRSEWLPRLKAADQAGICRSLVLDALGELKEDSLIDECMNEIIQGNIDREVVMLRYIGRVAKGRKDLISKIEERQANVQKGSSEEIAFRKVLRKLRGPSDAGQQTEKIENSDPSL